jgi:PASTA domain
MALDGTIKLPLLGEVNKKYAVIGLGGAVAIVGIVIIRKHANATAASGTSAGTGTAAAGADTQTDPAGNTGVIDPQTGYVYGSPEDEAVLAQTSEPGFSDFGSAGAIDPSTGVPYADETPTPVPPVQPAPVQTSGPPYATRELWIEAAENDLDAPNLQTIAANVFAGIGVTDADKSVFLEAVALEGSPPGGYPSPIKTTDTPGHPQPKPSVAQVTVPNVTGQRGEAAKATLERNGFKVIQDPASTPKGKSTTVTSQNPLAGSKAAKGSTVAIGLKVT